jgi:hypothetical protein
MMQQQRIDQTHAYRMQTLEGRHLAQVQAITHASAANRSAAAAAAHTQAPQHAHR